MKQQGIMSEQDVVYALKFGKELPELKDQFQLLIVYLVMLALIGYSRDLYKRILSDYSTTFCYNTSSRLWE